MRNVTRCDLVVVSPMYGPPELRGGLYLYSQTGRLLSEISCREIFSDWDTFPDSDSKINRHKQKGDWRYPDQRRRASQLD